MTEKKTQILNAALVLFAKEGYRSTSTSKVAKLAGVSEGLIFRHFESKNGLLEAIIHLGEQKSKELYADIVLEPDPEELLRKYLEMIIRTSQDESMIEFWKLQFKIKWELERYGAHKMIVIEEALINAFTRLRYNHPEQEANLLLTIVDGLATRAMLQDDFDLEGTVEFLKKKYKIK